MDKIEPKYLQAVELIMKAILQSQYNAIRLANQEQLKLYFGIGRYISENSRKGFWGTGALEIISSQLKNDLPGLMGFGVSSLKNMRIFYEAWATLDDKSPTAIGDLQTSDNESVIIRQPQLSNLNGFPMKEFFAVPFTHHIRILEKVKDRDERIYYIQRTALSHLSKDALLKAISADDYHHRGALPNNFLTTIPDVRSARRAIRAFKDEYLLDFINVEELDAGDIEDVDEKVLENEIVENIRDFILKFGKEFLFIKNQYAVEVNGHTFKIDLLFFNRELNALVAVKLKRGPFKTAYLGQLNGYLTILDDFVRKPHENSSIGLVLCKSADTSIVEYLIKDYNKPMGVATYRTKEEMPEKLSNALPDIEDLKKLL
jgi:predicted nuclease of restriction endonuclease-like (RecB) superfamily